jgi:hypothetical protein
VAQGVGPESKPQYWKKKKKKYIYIYIYIYVRNLIAKKKRATYLNNFFFFFFWWDWGLKSGLHAYKAGTVTLEPHL